MRKYLRQEGLLPDFAESERKSEEDTISVPPSERPMQAT